MFKGIARSFGENGTDTVNMKLIGEKHLEKAAKQTNREPKPPISHQPYFGLDVSPAAMAQHRDSLPFLGCRRRHPWT